MTENKHKRIQKFENVYTFVSSSNEEVFNNLLNLRVSSFLIIN